jgi:hypothetical protein
MKGGAWGEDILKWATMIFAFLFGIGVAILGIWTIFNVFRGRTRQRRNRNGNRNNGNPNTGLGGAPVPEPAPPNNGMEGFKLR